MLDAIAPNFPRAETIEAAGKPHTHICVLYVTIVRQHIYMFYM